MPDGSYPAQPHDNVQPPGVDSIEYLRVSSSESPHIPKATCTTYSPHHSILAPTSDFDAASGNSSTYRHICEPTPPPVLAGRLPIDDQLPSQAFEPSHPNLQDART